MRRIGGIRLRRDLRKVMRTLEPDKTAMAYQIVPEKYYNEYRQGIPLPGSV